VGYCTIEKPPGTYDYPIKPGTSQWTFSSQQEKLNAVQISQNVLQGMTTQALVQTCLDCPVLADLALNVGVNVPGITNYYMTNFSGLIELSKRNDAGLVMLSRYQALNPACIVCKENDVEKGDFSLGLSAFEMIFGHDSIVRTLSFSQKKETVTESLRKYKVKDSMYVFGHYADYELATSIYLMAKIMMAEGYLPFMQLYNSDSRVHLFIQKLLWPVDNRKMFYAIMEIAIQFCT
jgi:hypothetical protein